MASLSLAQIPSTATAHSVLASSPLPTPSRPLLLPFCGLRRSHRNTLASRHLVNKLHRNCSRVVCAVGDVSPAGTSYLIIGAIGVAVLGTAFPILFSRKDLCPECDGAGFIRKSGTALAANAARKDQEQIVCPRCNGLGKLGQVDK